MSCSQIGRYGTISLLKRNSENDVLTAFGIDAVALTFGREPSCGVRLYYADVALVHARIVFEDRKAFIAVIGQSGVTVDGCAVYPITEGEETVVPLTNGSEFEIHGKRFRFTYPPKEMREALYSSPVPTRVPRLSLIQSTQVFDPRPSPDPRKNLRVLQSPLKNPFMRKLATPLRTTLFAKYAYNSPVKAPVEEEADEEEQEQQDSIVLVEGNHPRVVEDDKDLVILEDVDVPFPSPATHAPIPSRPLLVAPQPQHQPPRTPQRPRSLSRNTLHRAVLIRSAQRAVLKAERDEREKEAEEEEEREVIDAVAGVLDDGEPEDDAEDEFDENDEEDEDVDMIAPLAPETDSDEEYEEEDENRARQDRKQQLGWRKSLERLWPFRSSSPSKEEERSEPEDDERSETDDDDEHENENEMPTEPRDSSSPEEDDVPTALPPPTQTPIRPMRPLGAFMTPQPRSQKKAVPVAGVTVGDEERKAIQERRRSALRDAGGVGFVPGMGGVFGSPVKSMRWSPIKPSTSSSSVSSSSSMVPPMAATGEDADEEAEDTRSLLEKMKETVEGMKRRRSLAPPTAMPPVTPRKQNVPTPAVTPMTMRRSPSKPGLPLALKVHEEEEKEGETFSLLRPGVLDELRAVEAGVAMDVDEPVPEVEVTADVATDALDEEQQEEMEPELELAPVRKQVQSSLKPPTPARRSGRSRSRPRSPMDEAADEPQEKEQTQAPPGSKAKSKPKTPARRTTRAATLEADAMEVEVEDAPAVLSVEEEENPKPQSKSKSKLKTPTRPTAARVTTPDEDTVEDAPAIPTLEVEVQNDEEDHAKPQSKSKSKLKTPARRTTRVRPSPVLENEEIIPPVPAAPKARARKTTTSTSAEEQVAVEAPAPVKRGRKPAAPAPAPAEEAPTRRVRKGTVEPVPVPVKRGRKPAAAASAEEPEDVSMGEEVPASTPPAPARRGTRRAAPVEEPVVRQGRTLRAGTGIPAPKASAARAAEVVEEPGVEVDEEVEVVEKKPVKGPKRAGTIKQEDSVVVPIPAAKTPAAKAGTRARKTPATAPAAVPAQTHEVDKENTQGKIRVSKTAGGKAARAKREAEVGAGEDEDEDELAKDIGKEEAPRGRVMRAVRTRTRT
ncbi:hypothetical protein C0991_012253 [Blastosporella zonata]|nr:hypothetical protein C0991_012253 [Blastosporella zonata]